MKQNLLIALLALGAGSLLAADVTPKDAAKKLADQKNYSWKTTVDAGANARWRPGPTEGKTEKDGFTMVSVTFNDNTTEAVIKGDKCAISTEDGWQTAEELSGDGGGQPNPGRFLARMFTNYKTPAAQAEEIASKTKDLKEADGAWKGDLTEEGAKQLLSFGRRGGGAGPEISNAKGWAKFWIKDGVLTKYEFNVQGDMSFNNNDMKIDRTTTTEIKDVGATKIAVPDGAKKKLS